MDDQMEVERADRPESPDHQSANKKARQEKDTQEEGTGDKAAKNNTFITRMKEGTERDNVTHVGDRLSDHERAEQEENEKNKDSAKAQDQHMPIIIVFSPFADPNRPSEDEKKARTRSERIRDEKIEYETAELKIMKRDENRKKEQTVWKNTAFREAGENRWRDQEEEEDDEPHNTPTQVFKSKIQPTGLQSKTVVRGIIKGLVTLERLMDIVVAAGGMNNKSPINQLSTGRDHVVIDMRTGILRP